MEPIDFQTLLEFFKVMANESRLKMVGILAQRQCSVEELAALLSLKEPTISHHLAKLKELNLVQMQPEGNQHLYRLDSEALQALNKAVLTANPAASMAQGVTDDAWETKVLKSYFEEGRLTQIPASHRKRWVILKWLARQFEIGTLYPEKQVNEILQRYHFDSATLRREFISYQMMQRENGVYWREPEERWKAV
ncbi:MAG: metalloregulator ArsR/SmtB family transcription factor [Oculatellaceae cyanobacterium Prado106]|nr:metalloregulator ArsR/SmtB family transcription factor [Oculatellaceae cyanobacterium Prado106]